MIISYFLSLSFLNKFSGEHVKETKTQAPLMNGEAIFDDRLNIPATLYYDKKKDGYLPKDVFIFEKMNKRIIVKNRQLSH